MQWCLWRIMTARRPDVLANARHIAPPEAGIGTTLMQITEPRTFRWTRDEFYRLADLGCFDQRRVELIEGEIIEMPVPKPPHVTSVSLTEDVLRIVFGVGFGIRTQSLLNLGAMSDAEPDISVVPGTPRDYTEHPTGALLVVEVSETTLAYDRGRKGSLY